MVRILSWNVNGLRALLGKRNLREFLDALGADVVCVQETKTTKNQLDCSGVIADGYNSYFSFCRSKAGYSGVATFCKTECTPVAAEEGLTGLLKCIDAVYCYPTQNDMPNELLQEIDAEGRAVLTEHPLQDGKSLVLINVYCPRADPDNVERLEYKLKFYNALQRRCQSLQQAGKLVVVVGDLNCCYGRIDSAYEEEEEVESSGEGQSSRDWLKSFIMEKGESTEGYKLIDSFRHLHPHTRQAYTCWSTLTSARSTNYGTRIDYVLIGQNLVSHLIDAGIMPDVKGSDHCPVYAELSISFRAADKPPSLCSSYWPEFAGKQKTISACFTSVKQGGAKRLCEDKAQDLVTVKKSKLTSTKEKSKHKQEDKQKTLSSYFAKTQQEVSYQDEPTATKPVHDFTSEELVFKTVAPPPCTGLNKEWKRLLKGPPKPPLCDGHREPCVRRKVKKEGPNFGKEFFVCARPAGSKGNTAARCNHFQWIENK